MFFQETTPDTSGYMIAGYAVAFIVMALYAASLYLRARNLSRDMTTLEEMDQAAPASKSASSPVEKEAVKPPVNKSAKTVTKNSLQN